MDDNATNGERDLTFEDLLNELHALIGRWVGVAVYGRGTDVLAGFTGSLVAGVAFSEGDRLVFRVRSDDPDTRSVFFLDPATYEGARWRQSSHGENELLIEVRGGALGITLDTAPADESGDYAGEDGGS
jgi:hypothetical protein